MLSLFCLADEASTNRPSSWAQPIRVEGVGNLYKVSDALYRSEQPTEAGMQNLATLGIKTVINLRAFHSDRHASDDTDLAGERIRMKTWHPEREDVVRFLEIVIDPDKQPVLVHCQHGSDRTGTMCAIYRIAVQGWSKQEAIREMTEGGYGFHEIWKDLPEFIENLDIESLRKDIGILTPPAKSPEQ